MYLRIAGFTIHVTSVEPDLNLALSPASARFEIEPAPPDVRVEIVARHLPDEDVSDLLFDSGGPWRLHRHGDGLLFRFFSPALGSAPYKTARVSRDFTSCEVVLNQAYLAAGRPIDPLEYPLDELLVIHLLAQGRGLEIHGCGVIDASGTGYLFAGQSGAGKTTMARLWLERPGTVIVSDDRVVLRSDADGLWMYGTPWHGDAPLASPRRVRLAHVFFLTQHSENALVPLAGADAVARLFAASFPPFHSAAALDFTLRFLAAVVEQVPCDQLSFTPTAAVPDLVSCAVLAHRLPF